MKDDLIILPAKILVNTLPDRVFFELIHDFRYEITIIVNDMEIKISIDNEVCFRLGNGMPALYNFKTRSDFYVPIIDSYTLSMILHELINRSFANFNGLWLVSDIPAAMARVTGPAYLDKEQTRAVIEEIFQ